MRHLRRAVDCTDSAYLGTKRDWIGGGDPDLTGLRPRSDFRGFEIEYFVRAQFAVQRTQNAQQLRLSHYVAELLISSLARLRLQWELRANTGPPTISEETAKRWRKQELDAWCTTLTLSKEHRHWQTRLELLGNVQHWAVVSGQEPYVVPFPRHSDDPVVKFTPASPSSAEDVRSKIDRLAVDAVKARDDRLDQLRDMLRKVTPSDSDPDVRDGLAEGWEQHLTATRWDRGAFCRHRAEAWRSLEVMFRRGLQQDGSEEPLSKEKVQNTVEAVKSMLTTGGHLERPPIDLRDGRAQRQAPDGENGSRSETRWLVTWQGWSRTNQDG